MKAKLKGTRAEHELMDRLNKQGYWPLRIAGSGCSKYPSCDLIVGCGNKDKIYVIEVKSTSKETCYISQEQIEHQLQFLGFIFRATPIVFVKFGPKWYEFNVSDLIPKEKSYLAVKSKGIEYGFRNEEEL